MECAVCRTQPATVGLICESCRDDVALPIGLLPQQILATIAKPTGDAVIDQWGRAHALESRTMFGRALDSTGILILDASTSRRHAHLSREGEQWRVRDLGSSNGTFHNDQLISELTAVNHGDRITIGAVGFYLVCGLGEIPVVEVDSAIITTIRSLKRTDLRPRGKTADPTSDGVPVLVEREQTDLGLPVLPIKISEPSGGGGGILEIGSLSVQLSTNQAELIGLLARRMLEESHQPTLVRGFVRSSELLGTLSWDTHEPDDNHIKQLVRRARRLLIKAGLGDLIESRQRFGYRLRLIPASLD